MARTRTGSPRAASGSGAQRLWQQTRRLWQQQRSLWLCQEEEEVPAGRLHCGPEPRHDAQDEVQGQGEAPSAKEIKRQAKETERQAKETELQTQVSLPKPAPDPDPDADKRNLAASNEP